MTKNSTAIRLSITKEVSDALVLAKKRYPTLSDPEILKLGLSKIITEDNISSRERRDVRLQAAAAVGLDYLSDADEDLYSDKVGQRVHFT